MAHGARSQALAQGKGGPFPRASSLLPGKPMGKVQAGTRSCSPHLRREVGGSTGSAGRSQTAPGDPAGSEVVFTPALCGGSLEGSWGRVSPRPADQPWGEAHWPAACPENDHGLRGQTL